MHVSAITLVQAAKEAQKEVQAKITAAETAFVGHECGRRGVVDIAVQQGEGGRPQGQSRHPGQDRSGELRVVCGLPIHHCHNRLRLSARSVRRLSSLANVE